MAHDLTKRDLEHLAELSRIALDPQEEEKLLRDLGNILDHFKELQKLDVADVPPMTGGTDLTNVFRKDGAAHGGTENTNRGAGVSAFPEKEGGYLRVPPVFG